MRLLISQALWYAVASGIALATDVGILWALVELLGWSYLPAAALSFASGTIVIYVLSVSLIFDHRRVDDRRLEFGAFAAIGAVGMLVNLVVLNIAVESLGLHYLVGKLAAICFTFVINFGLRRGLLFSAPSRSSAFGQVTTRKPT